MKISQNNSKFDLFTWKNTFISEFENDGRFVGRSERNWTIKIKNIIHKKMREKLNYTHQCICQVNDEYSFHKEYMGIDMTWMDEKSYNIPDLILEIENDDDQYYIAYCLWKLFCHKCKTKVLIAFPSNPSEVIKYLDANFKLEGDETILILLGKKFKGDFEAWTMRRNGISQFIM